MIERNVRVPGRVFGDIRSQLAACEIAARGMTDLVARYGADDVAALMVGDDGLLRAADAPLPVGTAGRRGDVHRLDRRRPDRRRRADQAGLHGAQARRHDGGGLDRQCGTGEGRDQQHLELHRGDELHRGEVGAVDQHAEQRRRVPPDQGHRAAGHDHQRQAAGGVRRARADRIPRRRLLLRRAGATVSGPGVSRRPTAATPA